MQPKAMPPTPTVLAPLVVEALQKGPLRRRELFGKVTALAQAGGFTVNMSGQTLHALKKTMLYLKSESRITSPQPGYWRLSEGFGNLCADADDALAPFGSAGETDDAEEIADAYAELAKSKRLGVWECKIGSSAGDPDVRIIG